MGIDISEFTTLLRARCAGPVLAPDDEGYDDALRGQIPSVRRRPSLVLRARDTEDIVFAVATAAACGATVGVLATGHSARRAPEVDLLLRTSDLRGVSVDATHRSARVEAGALWGDVVAATEPFGLVPVCGSHSSVGAVGFTLGGGLGPLGRGHGFAAERVRAFEVVTAEGVRLRVDDEHHVDLFRALRGGGRNGLAVVLEMTIDLVPLAGVFGGSMYFSAETAAEVFRSYAEWTRSAGGECTSSLAVVRVPDAPTFPEVLRGRTAVQFEMCHTGAVEEAEAVRAEAESWGEVLLTDLSVRPFSELLVDAPPSSGWGGALGLAELASETVGAFLSAVGPGCETPFFLAQLRQLGGALGRAGSRIDAVSGRDAEYLIFLVGEHDPAEGPMPAAARELFARLGPWASDAVPINFADHLDRASRELAWPEPARSELAAARDRWDPAGMFASWAGV